MQPTGALIIACNCVPKVHEGAPHQRPVVHEYPVRIRSLVHGDEIMHEEVPVFASSTCCDCMHPSADALKLVCRNLPSSVWDN
jgi:hypothetical protein